MLTDNGKEFTDRLFGLRKRAATGAHEFDTLCAALEIEHRLSPPAHPQTNGMVERFNGRIEEVLQSHHVHSGEDLETTLHRYVLYNQQLPQSALGSKTPLQAMLLCSCRSAITLDSRDEPHQTICETVPLLGIGEKIVSFSHIFSIFDVGIRNTYYYLLQFVVRD